MPAPLTGGVSALLVIAGVLCLYEYTLYEPAEKRRAPRRFRAFLGAIVLATLVGAGGLVAAVAAPEWRWPVATLLAIVAALPAFSQHLVHRALGRERGPLTERLAARWS